MKNVLALVVEVDFSFSGDKVEDLCHEVVMIVSHDLVHA